MKFKEFAEYLEKLEKISGRNDMIVALADLLKHLQGEETKYALYLIQGRLIPKYVNLEFNFSRKLIFRALETMASADEIKDQFSKFGDVGLVAEKIKDQKSKIKSSESISEVYEKLKQIALAAGKGSQEAKINFYLELIKSLDPQSIRYVSRVIVGELRLGISDKSILDALSWFVKGDKSLRPKIEKAFGAKADIGELALLIIENIDNVEKKLENIKIEPGIPIASKLVERESSAKTVWERMPNCFVQPKLDGLRGQLHYLKTGFDNPTRNKAAIFSRNMEDMTDQFPELTKSLEDMGVDSIVLDSEIIGFDTDSDSYLTYQETMQRKRKYDVEDYAENIPVRSMVFDVLYLNGEDLTDRPIEERIEILRKLIDAKFKNLKLLETKQMKSEEELEEYFKEKIMAGLEGVITKEQGSIYEPGTRNFKWIKLKANTQSELVDTLDVVIMGYYIGRGQRSKFGIGALLTGVYDPKTDQYYSVGKVGSGITDEMFPIIKADIEKIKTKEMPANYVVEKSLTPDYWVTPDIIAEIDADEITRSPNHTAARGVKTDLPKDNAERGLSIRFPRLKIWKRDKDLPNSIDELVRIYTLRKKKFLAGIDK